MSPTSPITEAVVFALIFAVTLMVLGWVVLARMIRRKEGFYLDYSGFGQKLKLGTNPAEGPSTTEKDE